MRPYSPARSKITAEHQQRRACVYVRQSSVFQVLHHRESTERQYHLRERALELGWAPGAITIHSMRTRASRPPRRSIARAFSAWSPRRAPARWAWR
jgi:hypothetical protein